MKLRIGVDVGGTNTDAVVLDGRCLLAVAKRPTTADVTEGIVAALSAVIAEAGVPRAAIGRVMIGTTHFTNAVVQRRVCGHKRRDRLSERKPHCLDG